MNHEILVIDDNEKLCKSLGMNFEQLGYLYRYELNSKNSLRAMERHVFDIILLDLALGEESGLELLKEINIKAPSIPIIMITGFGSVNTAVEAMKCGASDYVQKPLHFPHLLKSVENNLKNHQNNSSEEIIIRSRVMKDLFKKADKLAQRDFPLLITGDSGTGKERLAHYIHSHSQRQREIINCINCASFPENLLDNELFGHEKGAYTGAESQFAGIFERADGGTLFMDEIGDMSLQTQAKILRTLQNYEIRRIGGSDNLRIHGRFIGATNKVLQELMNQKRCREDLYYRLSTAVLHIPPLRERQEDIMPLAEYFLQEHFSERDLSFAQETVDCLLQYHWPGNIRELRNAILYSGSLAARQVITTEDLPQGMTPEFTEKFQAGGLDEQEKRLIIQTLSLLKNNKKKTAEKLNISRKTQYNKLEKYGISIE
ncbi:MAG: sigma-54 dependent transcriptional regulator [Spirochaetaceae bacterium]|jgi:two-component system response regulator AtoC|nr:sigma-54 dependent transcriptional regulator [Spirochaetaceae bacterium]